MHWLSPQVSLLFLVWSLESQGLLSQKQCGFWKHYRMLDHLVRFETFVRNAFVNRELTTECGSMSSWQALGILVLGVTFFLAEHSFRVRVGSTVLELHEQMGFPQGGLPSVRATCPGDGVSTGWAPLC